MCEYVINEGDPTCEDMFDCCDCGGNDCGCRYCWSCNACDECLDEDVENPSNN